MKGCQVPAASPPRQNGAPSRSLPIEEVDFSRIRRDQYVLGVQVRVVEPSAVENCQRHSQVSRRLPPQGRVAAASEKGPQIEGTANFAQQQERPSLLVLAYRKPFRAAHSFACQGLQDAGLAQR